MGKKTSTPDPSQGVAAAQSEYVFNKGNAAQNTQANRPNQFNQFGSSTWEQDPVTGQWSQTTALNQPQQDIFNTQQGNQQTLANTTANALRGFDSSQVDFSKLGAAPTVGGYNQQAIDTYRALQAPQLEQQRNAAEARLAAMGLNTGSGKAWENAQRAIGTNENQADLQAIQAGINQGNTEYQQALAGRQQGVSEILGQKQANLGQLSGLMGLGQQMGVPQFENFTAATAAPNLNIASGLQQSALDSANAANMDKSNNMQAVSKVASAAIPLLAAF